MGVPALHEALVTMLQQAGMHKQMRQQGCKMVAPIWVDPVWKLPTYCVHRKRTCVSRPSLLSCDCRPYFVLLTLRRLAAALYVPSIGVPVLMDVLSRQGFAGGLCVEGQAKEEENIPVWGT